MDYDLNSLFGLSGNTALVTGAAGQLGREMIQGLIACGANAVALDIDQELLDRASRRMGWLEERTLKVVCDVRRREDIRKAIDAAAERFGNVDLLVNNAGVSVFEPYLERPEESIDWVMDVNLKGALMMAQEFMKHQARTGGKSAVVNIGSIYGVISPDPRIYTDCERKNSEIYGATKAALAQMTKYHAVHAIEHGVRINCVSPGGIRNPDSPQGQDFQNNYGFRCPMGRMAETEEIVGAVLFLLSPAASYITGQNLVVDGGMMCW